MYIVGYVLLLSTTSATSETVANDNITSSCYMVNDQNYCFYTYGAKLSWNEAREFCGRRNSTLPIITDEDIDNVFQQFIVTDSYSVIQNRSVWIDAHARHVQRNDPWHWINGQQSGCYKRVNYLFFLPLQTINLELNHILFYFLYTVFKKTRDHIFDDKLK